MGAGAALFHLRHRLGLVVGEVVEVVEHLQLVPEEEEGAAGVELLRWEAPAHPLGRWWQPQHREHPPGRAQHPQYQANQQE